LKQIAPGSADVRQEGSASTRLENSGAAVVFNIQRAEVHAQEAAIDIDAISTVAQDPDFFVRIGGDRYVRARADGHPGAAIILKAAAFDDHRGAHLHIQAVPGITLHDDVGERHAGTLVKKNACPSALNDQPGQDCRRLEGLHDDAIGVSGSDGGDLAGDRLNHQVAEMRDEQVFDAGAADRDGVCVVGIQAVEGGVDAGKGARCAVGASDLYVRRSGGGCEQGKCEDHCCDDHDDHSGAGCWDHESLLLNEIAAICRVRQASGKRKRVASDKV